MASLYGVEVKALKTFQGLEGDCLTGTVYYKGRKLGYWSQDSRGGPDIFEFSIKFIQEAIEKYKNSNMVKPMDILYVNEEVFMSALVQLTLDEKEYKKFVKKGYNSVVMVTDGYHNWYISTPSKATSKIAVMQSCQDFINNCKAQCFKNVEPEVKVFLSFNDFVIE